MRYRFIRDNQSQFHIGAMCRVLKVSRSAFYDWLTRPKSEREKANDELMAKIVSAHKKSRRTYGSRRVQERLILDGETCSKNRVVRLMKKLGLKAKTKRKFRPTTNSRHSFPIAENLLERRFEAAGPNQVWMADITYIPTDEGWLYLAAVMDLHSRKIIGWSMGDRVTKELAIDALKMAIHQRKPAAGLVHHSDRGVQYASGDYQDLLRRYGMLCSMSRKGNCWDNAAMESFFGTLKMECTHHRRYHSRNEARRDIFYYIEVFYNDERLHSSLGYRSPAQYELKVAA
jgi:putative transposase